MNRPHTPLLAVVLAVALAACTNTDAVAPPPTASPDPPEATNSDGPTPLDEASAIELYVALQHAIIQLAPTDPADIEIEGAGKGIVVEGSPAAEFLTDRLTTMAETGTGPSGEVVDAEALQLPGGVPGERQTAELCVLQEVEIVDLASGQTSAGAPPAGEARYTQIDVVYRNNDGWLIDDLPGLEANGPPDDCVPPSIEQAVRASWEAHEEAVGEWIDASFAVEARALLEGLVTEARWQEIEATDPEEPTGRVQGDISYDLELLRATSTEVAGEWCLDGNRDPEATTLRNGELVDNDSRSLVRGRWRLEDSEWLVAEHDESRGDVHILAGTVDAPEGHRCL